MPLIRCSGLSVSGRPVPAVRHARVFRILKQPEPYSVTLAVRAISGQECGLLRMRSLGT